MLWYNYVVEGSQAFLFAGQIAAILLIPGSLDKNPAEQSGGYLVGGIMQEFGHIYLISLKDYRGYQSAIYKIGKTISLDQRLDSHQWTYGEFNIVDTRAFQRVRISCPIAD